MRNKNKNNNSFIIIIYYIIYCMGEFRVKHIVVYIYKTVRSVFANKKKNKF